MQLHFTRSHFVCTAAYIGCPEHHAKQDFYDALDIRQLMSQASCDDCGVHGILCRPSHTISGKHPRIDRYSKCNTSLELLVLRLGLLYALHNLSASLRLSIQQRPSPL
jgi:hypothetical protein